MPLFVGFVKAQSDNLPKIDALCMFAFFKKNPDFTGAELRGAKAERSGRESYGDNAIGYVQVKREKNLCTVKAIVTPEHKVSKKGYGVTIICDEVTEVVLSAECDSCAASMGGCKHVIAFLAWLHRRCEEPSVTEVACYWKKSKLSTVGKSLKFIKAKDLSKRERKRLNPQSSSFLAEVLQSISIKAFEHWRHGYRRLGKLMVSEGRLPDEDLVFYLTLDEIQDLLETRSPSIISRANQRRKIVPILHKLRFPEIMKGLPKPINVEEESENAYVADLTMKGIPVSQGLAKGYARVAKTLEEASSLQAGEILITYCTDIGWSPYFPIIAGVVTEMGGLISHGAVVSREYGLPCVVGIEGATKNFRTGDYVLLDGKKGVLQRLPQPEDNSE